MGLFDETINDSEMVVLDEYREKVKNQKWRDSLIYHENSKTVKEKSVKNCELFLEHNESLRGLIGYNEFSGYIHLMKDSPELNRSAGPWEDSFEDAITAFLEEQESVLFSDTILHKAVVNVARRNTFNPVKDRIEKVKWDGKPRLETMFIDLLGVEDNLYTREVTKRWVVGSVARIYKPGVKFEIVPILDGPQGIGKSTVPALLYTSDFFTDSLDSMGDNKDDYMKLQGNVIVELGELSSMAKTKIEKTKNFISARIDKFRPPYARNDISWRRQCVFIGTSNNSEYLKDDTGNRRFYPLPCKNEPKMNPFKTKDNYFLQVLSEAKVLFDKGQRIYFSPDEDGEVLAVAKEYQEDARAENPMRDAIVKYLEMEIPDKWEEAPGWARRSYYQNYPESRTNQNNLKHFKTGSVVFYLVDSVLTADILEAVFGKQTGDLLNGRANIEAKKIGLIIENIPGWEKKRFPKKNNRRGFYNPGNAKMNKSRKYTG